MQARRGDAAEEGADIAAIGHARADAQHQPADHRGQQVAGRDPELRVQPPAERRRQQRAQDDADIGDRGVVDQDSALQEAGPRGPEGAGGRVPAQRLRDLRRPQGEAPDHRPGMAGDHQDQPVAQRQHEYGDDQRPGPGEQPPPAQGPAPERFLPAAAAKPGHREPDRRQQGELARRGGPPAELAAQRHRPAAGAQGLPEVAIEGGQEGAEAEEDQRHHHPHAPPPDGEQRAGAAGAAQLHADAEDEAARQHLPADRRQPADDPAAGDRLAAGHDRREQDDGQGHHQDLRLHPAHVAAHEGVAVGEGEAERRMIERDPQRAADQEQHAVFPVPAIDRQPQGPAAQQQQCRNGDGPLGRQRHGAARGGVGHGGISGW